MSEPSALAGLAPPVPEAVYGFAVGSSPLAAEWGAFALVVCLVNTYRINNY